MGPACCIFKRKISPLKLLAFLIAAYGFVIFYYSYIPSKYFQTQIDSMKFHELSGFTGEEYRLMDRRMSKLERGRHEVFGDGGAKTSIGVKRKENQRSIEKMYGNGGMEESLGIGAEPLRNTSSSWNTDILSSKMINRGCKEEGILKRYENWKMLNENISCVPHLMSKEACKFTKEAYKIDSSLQTCKDNETKIYCHLKQENRLDFVCSDMDKYRYCKLSWLDVKSGDVVTKMVVSDLSHLRMELKTLAIIAAANKCNFLFLQCLPKHDRKTAKTQLIVLPYKNTMENTFTRRQDKLNMNVVLLDSISRSHFHRSLPVVIQTFNEINSKVDTKAEVLEFELFQSVHGHSAENFHAFFTGKLLPKNMTAAKREQANVEVGQLYGNLKALGYETMYQDDLCWKYWWGTRMELGMAADWNALQKAINKSSIDYTGLTFASCKILGLNGLHTPFSGPENSQICLNGRFQHSYIFDHLLQYFKRGGHRGQRISFTTINTGHDYKGIRVQTLNQDLSQFVRKLSKLDNTLTIIMADHGNTYTTYTSTMLEGRFEMHHPSFFMILPEGVKKWLGTSALRNLRRNTKRLFTMIDVHKMIMEIAKSGRANVGRKSYEGGLLSLIPTTRQCDDLELALPNLCICEGWDTPAENDTTQTAVLEFAIGTLNNLIDSQRKHSNKDNDKNQWNCHRLFARSFRNVRQRSAKGHLITSLDFTVDSGRGSDQKEDVFHVEVRSTITHSAKSRNMALLNFDRLSQFGIYRRCKDFGVDAKLCVCSITGNKKLDSHNLLLDDGSINIAALMQNQHQLHHIPTSSSIKQSAGSQCILLLTKEFTDETDDTRGSFTVAVEVINICSKGNINVYLSIDTNNCQTSHHFPMIVTAEPQSIHFASVIIRTVWFWMSSYRIVTSTMPDFPSIPDQQGPPSINS